MIFRRRRRLVAGLTLGLATAALAAPAAQADRWYDDSAQAQTSTSSRPDDRAGARITATSLVQANDVAHHVRPDDRSGVRGVGAIQAPEQPVSAPAAGDGFNWGDAGVGAGSILGALLLAGAAMLTLRRGRTGQPAGA